jgi:hypothetical protein
MKHLRVLIAKLAQAVLGLALLAFFVYLMLEWAVGCGESYTDSKGVTHTNECIVTIRK